MYLMNVPPFAATRTEWRTCGPPQDFSLHGFHSSDSELSTGDANIQDKVQMIIKSLRSTQSSIDMGDENAGNVPPGQEVHLEACKFVLGPLVGSKSSTDSGTEHLQTQSVFPIKSESQDSDSDDSVDRGIEEAILEYLKEKDGHKRKAEPSTNILQPSKVQRKNTPVPEISKQHSDSNIVLSASNQFPKIPEFETPMAPVQSSVTKNNSISPTPFKENPVKKTNISRNVTTKIVLPKQPKISFLTGNNSNKLKDPVTVKEDGDSLDSSSDDGIEEAIQKYQLEKQDKPIRSNDACNSVTSPDSSSDDGIEEAIRCYQLEQLKEKSVFKPFVHKQRPSIKSPIQSLCGTKTEKINRLKSKKKRKNKNLQSGPPLSSVLLHQSTLFGSSNSNGNGALLLQEEPFKLHAPATTKTTSAELLCAEAILDISKAVMPVAFSADVGINSLNKNELLSAPSTTVDDRSSGSSIDSEDGIEQEIRMFLEQKAQMQKQPQTTAPPTTLPTSLTEPDKTKGKPESGEKKVLRLSLTQRKKQKLQDCKKSATSPKIRNELTLKEDGEGSSSLVPYQMSPSSVEFDKTERGGDKSSSLDSDEDLDMAIKDLLKTKKKLKKKTRDMKLKTRKCLKDPESCHSFLTKKSKLDPVPKKGVSKKAPMKNREMSKKTKVSRKSTSPQKQNIKTKVDGGAGEPDQLKGTGSGDAALLYTNKSAVQGAEDSSSVDSDDSIEQEIQKFLAEKAKVTPAETKNKDGDVPIHGNIGTQLPEKAIKLESQLAEIPTLENTCLPDGQCRLFQDGVASMTPLKIGTTCPLSLLSCSPSLLQHADGDVLVKTDDMRPTIGSANANVNANSEKASPLAASTPSVVQPFSDSMKWRQSLGLPITNTRPVNPSRPSHIISPSINDTAAAAAATPPYHRARINSKHSPVSLWTSARSSRPASPIRHYPETSINTMSSSVLDPFCATNTPGRSPVTGLASGSHRAAKPVLGQAERDNRLASPSKQDQGTFTRLDATRRSCQVWAQSMPMSEGSEEGEELTNREKEEREVIATAEKAVQCIKTEAEDFVDETYCELDERRDAEKTRGVSSMFLSERAVIATADKAVQCLMTEAEDFVDETDCELDERRDAEKTRGVSSIRRPWSMSKESFNLSPRLQKKSFNSTELDRPRM